MTKPADKNEDNRCPRCYGNKTVSKPRKVYWEDEHGCKRYNWTYDHSTCPMCKGTGTK